MLKPVVSIAAVLTLLSAALTECEGGKTASPAKESAAAEVKPPVAVKTATRSEDDPSIIITELEYEYGKLRFTSSYKTEFNVFPNKAFGALYTFWPGLGDRSTIGDSELKDTIRIIFGVDDKTSGAPIRSKYGLLSESLANQKATKISGNYSNLEEYQLEGQKVHRFFTADYLTYKNQPLVIACLMRPDSMMAHRYCKFDIDVDALLGIRVELHRDHLNNLETIFPAVLNLIEKVRNGTL